MKWEEWEISFLKDNYLNPKINMAIFSSKLRRKNHAISTKARRIGLSQDKKRISLINCMRNKENNSIYMEGVIEKITKNLKEGYLSGRIKSPFKGKPGRVWKKGHPKGMLGKHHSDVSKEKISKSTKGDRNPFYGKTHSVETKNRIYKKISKIQKEKYKDERKKEEFLRKMLMTQHKRPTKPERYVIKILESLNLDFVYSGDGRKCIGGFFPDFIQEEYKLIIEVNGRYWHTLPNIIEKDHRKYLRYKKEKYSVLILWDDELTNEKIIKDKIINFYNRK